MSADNSDDTVPIVVGCVLAGLIAVVMVSYFVLRARAKWSDVRQDGRLKTFIDNRIVTITKFTKQNNVG